MIGQPPHTRLRLVASNPPRDEPATTRDLYRRIAATRNQPPELPPHGYTEDFRDWPDAPYPDDRDPFETYLVRGSALFLAFGAGAAIVAVIRWLAA